MLTNAIDAQALIDLKILLVVACCLLTSPYIAKFLRLPTSATEIMLGAGLCAIGFIGESANFKLLAQVGFCFLMFMAGMEVDLHIFFSMKKSFLKRAFFYIILLYAISGAGVSLSGISSIFVIILPVMSVGVLSILFRDFGKDKEWLNTAMLVATLAEVVSITLLTIVAAILSNENYLAVAKSFLYLFIFLAASLLCFRLFKVLFRRYPRLKIIIMPWRDRDEKDIRFCMGVFFLIIAAMIASRLEIALGAFIAGSFIATFFDHKRDLEHKLRGFGFGLLIPIFFIYIGSTFEISALLNTKVLQSAILLLLAMIFLRLLSALVFVRKFGFKNTLLFALSHSMPLTLLTATATLSRSADLISQNLYSAMILTALLEAVLVMSLIKFLYQKFGGILS